MEKLLEKIDWFGNESDTWKGFIMRTILGFCIITLFLVTTGHLFVVIFGPILYKYRLYVVSFVYLLSFLVYSISFIHKRTYRSKITFSKKTNIVMAYNLEAINEEKFRKKYNSLIKGMENEIRIHGLGDKVKIIVCPSNIKIKTNSVAEAKLKLGLMGATLLVWGHVKKDKGKYMFITQFSYEFAHPNNIREDEGKKRFGEYIERILNRGLFTSIKMDFNKFEDQILSAVYFIFAITTNTLGLFDKSEIFLNSFLGAYQSSDLMRKRDLGPAFVEAREMLINIHQSSLNNAFTKVRMSNTLLKECAEKILKIDPNNYNAYIALSYYHEKEGNRSKAVESNLIAETFAHRNNHQHHFNKAYFALQSNRYSEVISIYENIPNITLTNTTYVIADLDRLYKKEKNIKFLFATGYVTWRWGIEKDGIVIFKKVYRQTKDKVEYLPFNVFLKKVLEVN